MPRKPESLEGKPGAEIAQRLRDAVESHPTINGWAELARVAGESPSNTQSILSGRISEPRARILYRLCVALNVSMGHILGEGGDQAEADYRRGYRHGVADAVGAVRGLMDDH